MSRRNVVAIASGRRNVPTSAFERALLPWEDRHEFETLRVAFHGEHRPQGPTEASLVEQLAWLDWRRRRLVIGERAAHMASLQDRLGSDYKAAETVRRAMIETGGKVDKDELGPALSSTPGEDAETLADNDADEGMTRRAIAILETGDPASYDEALAALREDTASWWERVVSDDEETHPDGKPQEGDSYQPYARNRGQLLRFLSTETMASHTGTRGETGRRPAIRLQAHGESLDPLRINLILTLDERLTRQFEKTLSMLIRLQEMRRAPTQASA